MLLRIALVLSGSLLTVSCSVAPVASSTEAIVTEVMMATYIDNEAGFAFEYPANWHQQEFPDPRPYRFGLTTYDPLYPPVEAAPENASFVSMNFGLLPPTQEATSVVEWAERYRQELETRYDELKSERELTLPSGLHAVRFRVSSSSGMTIDTVLVIVNDYRLVIGAQGNFNLVDRVLNTLRPA